MKQTIAKLLLLATLCIQPISTSAAPPTPMKKRNVPNQVIVVPRQGLQDDDLQNSLKDVNGTIVGTTSSGTLTCYLVQLNGTDFDKRVDRLKKDKNFNTVQLNMTGRKKRHDKPFTGVPNDPSFPQQWHFSQMNVVDAWNQGATGSIKIGIIDDGVRASQIDLEGKVQRGYNAILNQPGGDDARLPNDTHGTPVATFAAALTNNRILGAGPAYQAVIVPVDVFDHKVQNVDDFTLIKSLQWLQSQGVKLTNMSLNQDNPEYYSNQKLHPVLHMEFTDNHNRGGLLFNAAGNESTFDPNPRTRGLIVIAGTNSNGGIYKRGEDSGTNFGKSVWFAAPGEDVVSSDFNNQILTSDGTSFSSPLACSVAALVWTANPSLTNDQVLEIMVKTATKPPGYKTMKDYYGYGIPNAGAAVRMAKSM